jgi:Terminase RNaseH-like domain
MTSNPSSPFEDIPPAAPSWDVAEGGEYTCGVDLGRSFDPTAVAIIRKVGAESGRPLFQCGYLTRLPLQMTYPAQVAQIKQLVARLRGNCELVIDHTGVGKAVADIFAISGLATVNVTITAGDATTQEGLDFHVPKLSLVSRLQALLHNGQLKIHRGLADAQTLVEELQNFQASVTDSGTWRFGPGDHPSMTTSCSHWRSLAGDQLETQPSVVGVCLST